jgi:hypothetical protein
MGKIRIVKSSVFLEQTPTVEESSLNIDRNTFSGKKQFVVDIGISESVTVLCIGISKAK